MVSTNNKIESMRYNVIKYLSKYTLAPTYDLHHTNYFSWQFEPTISLHTMERKCIKLVHNFFGPVAQWVKEARFYSPLIKLSAVFPYEIKKFETKI